ncbi:hypothetical protein F4780DRAFT_783396 [Xylariomycetidae sp. FL0641]|nr:hypothetical protein F4780DRAFT_783396 [Xylariomycetidae sp. FL0641]
MHHHHHHTTTGWDRSGGPGRSGFAQVPQHDATIDDWNAAHDAGFDNEVDDRQEQEQQQQQEQEARQQAGQGQEHQQGLWERFTRDGFASVPQSDVNGGGVDGHHHQAEEQPQPPSQRSSSNTKDQFRDTIQQLFRKSAAWYDPDDSSLEEGSPALTDDTLVGDGEGYLDLPIQRFEEVDIGLHENFAEYHGYYGPEVTVCLSPSKSTRAGKGLEVRVEEIPYNGPTDGCFIDKQYGDTAYRGSEGLLEKQSPTDLRQKNYKPLVLRGRFLLILLTALATLLGLAVFALLALPDASQNDVSIDSYQNITEIRRRSILLSNRDMIHGTTSSNKRQIAVDSGASVTSSPADQVSTTAAQSSVASTALPESAPTTDVPPSTQAPTTQVVQTPETSIESHNATGSYSSANYHSRSSNHPDNPRGSANYDP